MISRQVFTNEFASAERKTGTSADCPQGLLQACRSS